MTEVGLPARGSRRTPLVRYGIGLVVGLVVLVVLFTRRGDFNGASTRLAHLDWSFAVAAILAEAASLLAYALLQRRVLAASGARLPLGPLLAITLANNAIALSVPGEPAVSSLFRHRQYRQRGASEAGASWSVLTLLIAQAIGFSLMLVAALVVTLLVSSSGVSVGVVVIALVVVVGAGSVFLRRDLLVHLLRRVVRLVRRVTGHPRGDVAERVESTLEHMRAIRLTPRDAASVVALALGAWLLDVACLICAFVAVHAAVPWHGVLLAYGVAQIVAVLPIVPGGLGLVEGSLAVILVAYGARRVPALSAVVTYRVISFWLAIVVGWCSVAGLTLTRRRRPTLGADSVEAE